MCMPVHGEYHQHHIHIVWLLYTVSPVARALWVQITIQFHTRTMWIVNKVHTVIHSQWFRSPFMVVEKLQTVFRFPATPRTAYSVYMAWPGHDRTDGVSCIVFVYGRRHAINILFRCVHKNAAWCPQQYHCKTVCCVVGSIGDVLLCAMCVDINTLHWRQLRQRWRLWIRLLSIRNC